MKPEIHPHRLFVSGGSQLSRRAALLWHELGRMLAGETGLVVVTGGLRARRESPGKTPADWAMVEGVLVGLEGTAIRPTDRIETVLPDRNKDWDKLERFHVGHVRTLDHRNSQSRRFSMVSDSEIVIAIAGDRGTRSVLDMALAIERPILPLPFAGGTSADFWQDHQSEICEWFNIPPATAKEFSRIRLGKLSRMEIRQLAAKVHRYLMCGFTRSCFVIMRFRKKLDAVYEKAICPALEVHGLRPVRTDKHVLTGSIVAAIRDGLRHCFFAIADITGDSPNVMYELGMAHGINKPVIILRDRIRSRKLGQAPFDIRVERMIEYSRDMGQLRKHLIDVIRRLRGDRTSNLRPRKRSRISPQYQAT